MKKKIEKPTYLLVYMGFAEEWCIEKFYDSEITDKMRSIVKEFEGLFDKGSVYLTKIVE